MRISRPDKSSSIDYNEYILTPLEYLRLFITALLADMLVAYTFYQSRRVLLEIDDGEIDVDCNFGACPYEAECQLAAAIREKVEESK